MRHLQLFKRAAQCAGLCSLVYLAAPVSLHADGVQALYASYTAQNQRTPDAITVDGGHYFGPLVAGKLHGRGQIEWANGTRYVGEFQQGLMAGTGRIERANGDVYIGALKQATYWGEGTLNFADGRKYQGDFVRDQFHGVGQHANADGETYIGEFVKGEFSGVGTYTNKVGVRYAGQFEKWAPHGRGTYTDPNGSVYVGEFAQGEIMRGQMTAKDGARYDGEFQNWRYHGAGVLNHANGDAYRGKFAYGRYHGEGVLKYAKAQTDGATEAGGTWQHGQLTDPEKERLTRRNVERALLAQRPILDRALAALAPSDPSRINLYLLAIAGDGSQEVFRREAEFVRDRFDRELGTRGRSLALVNSRNTVESVPMATLTSIDESIRAIAARMNRDQDILFLFLTSHGSKEHQFVLGQNGMELRGLPPKELAELIRASGIRWKVIVVSACYAGGFIDPLKDERTLVITAARHDRPSFGCADDNDFTYFGRAYFKEALSATGSFEEAFFKADRLVKQWELKELKATQGNTPDQASDHHSYPQMHNPPAIRNHLERWRAQMPSTPQAMAAQRR